MKIPEVRDELHKFADQVALDPEDRAWLHFLADQTRRRRPVRRAPRQRFNKITKHQVLDFIRVHPTADNMAIGAALGVNTGRVSEKLAGYRT